MDVDSTGDVEGVVGAQIDRFRGALLGLAVGDAVGAAVEARAPGSFAPVTRAVFTAKEWSGLPNVHKLKAGQWTDDTSMALCLAESLLRKNGFDGAHQITMYRKWWKEGYHSATGRCFDIGNQVKSSLTRSGWRRQPFLAPPKDKRIVGSNGCIMRLSPVPMFFTSRRGESEGESKSGDAASSSATPADAKAVPVVGSEPSGEGCRGDKEPGVSTVELEIARMCMDSARTTHSTPACVDGAALLGLLIHYAVQGDSKQDILRRGRAMPVLRALAGYAGGESTSTASTTRTRPHTKGSASNSHGGMSDSVERPHPLIAAIANGAFWDVPADAVCNAAQIDKTLMSALWHFAHTDTFEQGCLGVVNCGRDADTVAAVYGQIAGAHYGYSSIPNPWLGKLAQHDKLKRFAEKLADRHGATTSHDGSASAAAGRAKSDRTGVSAAE